MKTIVQFNMAWRTICDLCLSVGAMKTRKGLMMSWSSSESWELLSSLLNNQRDETVSLWCIPDWNQVNRWGYVSKDYVMFRHHCRPAITDYSELEHCWRQLR